MAQQLYYWVYTKENWKQWSTQNLYMDVHCSIIHKNQKVETAQIPINWWMDKQKNMVHPHNGIIFCSKKQ